SYNTITKAFNLLGFSSLAFDLTQLEKGITTRKNSISELNSLKLKQKISKLSDDDPILGRAVSLYHDRHAKTLLALLFPTLGMISLLIGGYNRSGYTSRIVISVLIIAGFDLFRGVTKSWTADTPILWLLQYGSPFLCSFLITFMLWHASKGTTGLHQKANKVHL
ncbi:MAG: LptF/LptG family permease, partial [Rhodobacterales bacterium]